MKRRVSSWASTSGHGLSLSVLVLALGACGPGAEPPRAEPSTEPGTVRLTPEQVVTAGVRVEPIRLHEVAQEVAVPGAVSSPDTATAAVASLVEGRVEAVEVLPGDDVAEGAPLAYLHSHELTDALRDLSAARARLAFAEAALGRSDELLEAGAVSREEAERRRSERDALAADVQRAEEWVRHLNPDAEGHVVVRAPRPGVVFDVSVRPGSGVEPGTPLVTLGRTDVLWVTGWVPEREALSLEPGSPVTVRFQAIPGLNVEARVVRMAGTIDPLRRAVEVRAELGSVPPGVRPGAFATLVVLASEPEPCAVLPAEAVQRVGAGEVVFVETSVGTYRAVPVSSFPLSDGHVAVDGLEEGRRVVVAGAYAVRSAMEKGAQAEEEM